MRGQEEVPEDNAGFERDSDTGLTRDESADAPTTDVVDYGELGEHVASVLKAAELAAKEIRTQAEQEAAAKVSEAGRQAGKILHDAEGLRAETEEANTLMREQAEAYAGRTRRDADVEASKVLQSAEEGAAIRVRDEELRQRVLREDIKRTEKRLTELGMGLHALAAQLEELVSADRPPADEVDRGRGGDDASLDASLVASIGAERTTDAKS
jgi:vacuolar-type H+-ATPase subunit H